MSGQGLPCDLSRTVSLNVPKGCGHQPALMLDDTGTMQGPCTRLQVPQQDHLLGAVARMVSGSRPLSPICKGSDNDQTSLGLTRGQGPASLLASPSLFLRPVSMARTHRGSPAVPEGLCLLS